MTESPTPEVPAQARKWSGAGCAGVLIFSFAVFVVVQGVAGAVVLFRLHPEALRIMQSAFHGIPPPSNYSQLADGWTKDFATAPYLFLYALLGDGAMALVAIGLARSWLGAGLSQLGLGRITNAGQLWWGAATGIALIFASNIVSGAQAHFFGPHPEKVAELLLTHHGALSFVLDLASVAVIAPIAEELVFRGIVFNGLAQRMPVGAAAALSGVIFGVAHFDPWSILPLATIGAGLALLYRRTGSLWPNIVAHATVNTIALIAVYFLPQFAT